MVKKLFKIPNGISFPSNRQVLAVVDRYLERELKKTGLRQEAITDVAISVIELVTNAIKHGNREDDSKRVTLELRRSPKELTIYIEDEGNGFEPEKIPNPTEPEHLLKNVGRGIFVARSLVDSLEFSRGPKGGTRVKVVKKLP